jgi:peptidoglycan hydrolase-like protein with peptidoglycan-binding domain
VVRAAAGRGPFLALLLLLLGACGGPPTLAELEPAAGPAAPAPAEEARALREGVVLGSRLLGGARARALAPREPPLPEGAGPADRALALGDAAARRALASQQLLELWAHAVDGPEPRDEPEAVRRAQRLLAALGYYEGPLNGRNGPLSTAAIRRFQAIQGLPETGAVTASRLVALRAAL